MIWQYDGRYYELSRNMIDCIKSIKDLYNYCNSKALHIVLEDYDVSRHTILWCTSNLDKYANKDAKERALTISCSLQLLALSEQERYICIFAYEQIDNDNHLALCRSRLPPLPTITSKDEDYF